MNDFMFQQPMMLWLLPIAGVFLMLFIYRRKKQSADLQSFGQSEVKSARKRSQLEQWMLFFGVVCMIAALARPVANPQAKELFKEGRDVVFVLDVSKSMLAQDQQPNRLSFAKAAIEQCAKRLENHRLGLVVFAGSSSIMCPLTHDKDFFLSSLARSGPESVAHGGTRIADALSKVCDKLLREEGSSYKDVILLTDGDDLGSDSKRAVELVNEKQVKMIVLGIGDAQTGSRIPEEDGLSEYKMHEGGEVWSKLNIAKLTEMTKRFERGVFIPVGVKQMDLGVIYADLSKHEKRQQLDEESVLRYDELFPLFIGLSLSLLVLNIVLPVFLFRKGANAFILWVCVCLVGFPQNLEASDVKTARVAYDAGKYEEARRLYKEILLTDSSAELWYQKANCEYRLKNYELAIESYKQALEGNVDGELRSKVSFNLASTYYRFAKQEDDVYAGMDAVDTAHGLLQKIVLDDTENRAAAINLELVRGLRKIYHEKIARAEEQQKAGEEGEEVSQDQEGDEDSEGKEGETEEKNEESEMDAENMQEGENVTRDEITLPVPTDSPEDVIKKSEISQRERSAAGSKGKKSNVEKDW